jgi:hypothetical protein
MGRVAVLCEFSGTVRDAFIREGHSAASFDLLPTERPGEHYVGDVQQYSAEFWQQFDLAICHPPCTHLAVSGARWFKEKAAEQAAALDFVRWLMALPVPRIAIENPISIISSRIRKPDQIIQPWMFGHGETKATCLWLTDLPKLAPTDVVVPEWAIRADGSVALTKSGKKDNPTHYMTGSYKVLTGAQAEQWARIHKMPPGPDRWKERSRTYQGIADAMAAQWGKLI